MYVIITTLIHVCYNYNVNTCMCFTEICKKWGNVKRTIRIQETRYNLLRAVFSFFFKVIAFVFLKIYCKRLISCVCICLCVRVYLMRYIKVTYAKCNNYRTTLFKCFTIYVRSASQTVIFRERFPYVNKGTLPEHLYCVYRLESVIISILTTLKFA